MALVKIYTHENLPELPEGVTARVFDDDLEKDQEAAWAHARRVHDRIYWEIERKKHRNEKEASK